MFVPVNHINPFNLLDRNKDFIDNKLSLSPLSLIVG